MQQNTGYSMMCYQMSKQLQQICVHWVERTVVAHVKLTRRTGPVWQRSNLLIALMKTLKRLFYVLKHPALPFPLCTCTVINITYNILESYKWPDEKTLKDCQKLALKKIVFHLSWSTKNITTFPNAKGTGASIKEDKPHLSPLSRTSHTPSAQHRKSHSSTPFPWFRHPGPTLKRPLHSLSVQDISSPARLWPKGRCAALHWRPSVLHGSPAVCLSSSQDSTHHLPLQCQAAGWCPCPRHTQILE